MSATYPPKPASRSDSAGLWARIVAFRKDMFRSQPERLYRAKVARVRTPLYNSFFVNDPALIEEILQKRAQDFPKAKQLGDSLAPLLGRSVFTTNGSEWAAARAKIDPGFSQTRLQAAFPAMLDAGLDMVDRLQSGRVEIEFEASQCAADVIFRTLFSVAIEDAQAARVFAAFRAYQREQPLMSPSVLMRLPSWLGRTGRGTNHAKQIRDELKTMIAQRAADIQSGHAPADLATHLLLPDPVTGARLSQTQVLDQMAIFFLAGHETSASALAWAVYCLAQNAKAQDEMRREVFDICNEGCFGFEQLAKLSFTKDVFRETLRLYPPVPVFLREAACPGNFRGMRVQKGDLCMVSPWYAQRNGDRWDDPDAFDPWRWQHRPQGPYFPFSKGPRVCPGAGFAMTEGVLMLALLVKNFAFNVAQPAPVPVAHLTVRSQDGIYLNVERL